MSLSRKAYQASLPKKRMGAGCLFLDEQGQILLVKPGYKPAWEIPGGVVEANESPRACCKREILEEIGLARDIGRLLIVDYNGETDDKTESLMFIFYGGILTAADIAQIRLDPQELIGFNFFLPAALPEEMTDSLRNRILAAWRQVEECGAKYLEDQGE